MDFAEWCDLILEKLIEVSAGSLRARDMGVEAESQLPGALFGDTAAQQPEFFESKARLGIHDALDQWTHMGLVESRHGRFFKPLGEAEGVARDRTQLWQIFCDVQLKPEQVEVLRVVNRLSPHSASDHAWTDWVEMDELLQELGWAEEDGPDRLWVVSDELERHHFVQSVRTMGPNVRLKATYRGLVWEHKKGFTVGSRFVDDLVAEWETTSVEFKRELHTGTADEKAELVKDVIGLVNTQASGQRFLIVGFDDDTRGYYGPPDRKITQEHLEQLMSTYTDPVVGLRYEVIDYRDGLVGKLEVLRDPGKLPYRVGKSIGEKKRINQGDVFVRHGSLTEPPTPRELEAISQEGERARSL